MQCNACFASCYAVAIIIQLKMSDSDVFTQLLNVQPFIINTHHKALHMSAPLCPCCWCTPFTTLCLALLAGCAARSLGLTVLLGLCPLGTCMKACKRQ